MPNRILPFLVIGLLLSQSLFAYTYNKATVGPLSVEIAKPGVMRNPDEPLEIFTRLKNSAATPLDVTLTFTTIETIEFVEATGDKKTLTQTVKVPAGGQLDVKTAVVGKPGTLSVHYPIHLTAEWDFAGTPGTQSVTVVQPFESTITPNPNWPTSNPQLGQLIENDDELPLIVVPNGGGLALTDLTAYRVFWTQDRASGKIVYEPVGWQGSNDHSGASLSRHSALRGGISRPSLNMHPAWRGGPGNVGVDYRIKLPTATPMTFMCFGAMRDVAPPEPPTDGVTFRVVAQGRGHDEEELFVQKNIVGTNWEPIELDLTPLAGKEILLRLIADPGPKRDTTCDLSFWGDPTIFAGKKPTFADPVVREKRQEEVHTECVAAMKSGKSESGHTEIFELDGGQRVVLTSGSYGFADGKIAIGTPQQFIVYDGIEITVKDQPLAKWPTTLAIRRIIFDAATPDQTYEIEIDGKKSMLRYSIRKNGPALQLSIDCDEKTWITSIRLGPASEVVDKVYYGHGYCVVKPKAFTAIADGLRLTTSHVAFEYPNGLSMLLASTTAPRELVVDPEQKIATLVVHPATTLTLLPGDKGAFDCAIRYRAINPKKAASGVKTKAGRFCFDLWGGTYKRHDEIADNAIRYGLTDSLVIIHGWQRYGYDNRLPDIWPPNTGPGTLAQMQKTLKKCDAAGILYGLHDNYIDFYPDAEGYCMDVLSFERDGQPRKAWLNEGVNARSYQFRPDTFMPFLKRNFEMMLQELPQSCYFVDVFSSLAPPDFYDREGNLHTRAETLRHWGESFDYMREQLTASSRYSGADPNRNDFHAPTISESGCDFLIGHLDGADCLFARLDDKPNEFVAIVPCGGWERVPWFDAVNHTTFSLHGVGYSNRYEGGTGRTLHGIESDDYICAEIMTGHSLMVDLGSATRGAVRKYWLLQDMIRELADCEIESVEFVDGDIHRQKIVWKSPDGKRTTTVWINRGQTDWRLDEFALPPYGFLSKGTTKQAGIVRSKESKVVEFSTNLLGTDWKFYTNGRQQTVEGLLPIRVAMKPESFKRQDGNRFEGELLWVAEEGAPLDYSVFIHLVPDGWKRGSDNREGLVVVHSAEMPVPTTQWKGEIVTPFRNLTISDSVPAGKYQLLVGLYAAATDGHRAHLVAQDDDNARYRVGLLTVVRDKNGKLADMTFEAEPPKQDFESQLIERLSPNVQPIDFAAIRTSGAFLLEGFDDHTVLTPLPDEKGTAVDIRWEGTTAVVLAEDADGEKIREVTSELKDGRLTFTTVKGEFRYVIRRAVSAQSK